MTLALAVSVLPIQRWDEIDVAMSRRGLMAYHEDLSPCKDFGQGLPLIAVGWLDDVHPYPTGIVPPEVMQRLLDFCRNPWSLVNFLGPLSASSVRQ